MKPPSTSDNDDRFGDYTPSMAGTYRSLKIVRARLRSRNSRRAGHVDEDEFAGDHVHAMLFNLLTDGRGVS